MFNRNILNYFRNWKDSQHRKPLIVRGARQVGKTVAVKMFAKKYFDKFIYINLEKDENKKLFHKVIAIKELLKIIEIKYNTKIITGKTLIFIDEIQNSDVAMTQFSTPRIA